jgi:hypothetical protein
MSRRPFTLIFPYYDNPGMFLEQLGALAALPAEVRGALDLIVVDDGSPTSPLGHDQLEQMKLTGLRFVHLFRITVDVRWNWIAARNLAMAQAKTNWRLMTDIDHVVPVDTCRRIQEVKLSERSVYRFSRVDAPTMAPYKPHPNSWLLTGETFDRAGGYDERFSGFYGSDGEFRDRITRATRTVQLLPQVLVRYPREVIPDASTIRYERKQPEDRAGVQRARALIAADPTTLRGSFPWEEIL